MLGTPVKGLFFCATFIDVSYFCHVSYIFYFLPDDVRKVLFLALSVTFLSVVNVVYEMSKYLGSR